MNKEDDRKLRSVMVLITAILLCPYFSPCQVRVKTGDEVFLEKYIKMIEGKNVGIITNQTGMLDDGESIVDVLARLPKMKVVALFSPEHGIRGIESAGKPVNDSVDEKSGILVHSLYGATLKPTPEMLKGIDVLIYDIQDVGARFYTYISTLDLTMEAAAENHVKYIVLDRPDMLSGDLVDGPVLEDSLRSFVGMQPIPSAYGMTPGELATMINDEHMLKNGTEADLTVIKMENYKRSMWYDQTGLQWITPSPNLPDINSVIVYPGIVLIEATNISEGRGTEHPFETVGAPFIDSHKLINLLNTQDLAGVHFVPADFVPRPLRWASRPKYDGVLCHGVKLTVVDRNTFKAVETGVTLIWAIHKLCPDSLKFFDAQFDRLSGTRAVRTEIQSGDSPEMIFSMWQEGQKQFKKIRSKYLLYR